MGKDPRIQSWWEDQSTLQALHYGMTNFSASILNNVFITYYVELFTQVEGIGGMAFFIGQLIYCIWNCCNDPAFGWFGDTRFVKPTERRLPRIRIGGPLWALAFCMVWFPWTTAKEHNSFLGGLHFILTMLLYDGAMSWTLVAHSALLVDMTVEDRQREKCNMWSAGCHIAGCFVVFLAHYFWDPEDLSAFQHLSFLLALLACFGFYVTTSSPYVTERRSTQLPSSPTGNQKTQQSLGDFAGSLLAHRNFWVFAAVGVLQQFSCTLNTNFFSISLARISGKQLGHATQSTMLLAAFTAPHLCTLTVTPSLSKFGKFAVVKFLFQLRLLVAVGAAGFAAHRLVIPYLYLLPGAGLPLGEHPSSMGGFTTDEWLVGCLAGFLVLNRVLTECVCRLIPLIIGDLVDEDLVINKRKSTMASMYFGCHALVTKPAQSIAPLMGWYLLSKAGYDPATEGTESTDQGVTFAALQMQLATPVVSCIMMLYVWRYYTLQGRYYKFLKSSVAEDGCLV